MKKWIKRAVLGLAIIVPILGWVGASQHAAPATPVSPFTTQVVATDTDIDTIYTLINQQRITAGVPALMLNSNLNTIAAGRCNDMVTRNYYSHYRPEEATLAITPLYNEYLPNWKYEGENIDAGLYTPQQLVASWMGSIDHKQNILDSTYNIEGLAVCESNNFTGDGPQFVYVEDLAQI